MKILFLSATGALGGAERSLLDVLGSIRRARPEWQLELLTLGEGDLNVLARRMGVAVYSHSMPRSVSRIGDAGAGGPAGHQVSRFQLASGLCWGAPQVLPYIWKLTRFIRKQAPEIIHSNGFKTHILAAASAPSKIPVIWHVRDYVSSRPLMSPLVRLHARRCAVAITNSNSVANDLDDTCRHKLKIITVYNALDLACFSPEGPVLDIDKVSGLPPARAGVIRVGLIATAARWKGHNVFLPCTRYAARSTFSWLRHWRPDI